MRLTKGSLINYLRNKLLFNILPGEKKNSFSKIPDLRTKGQSRVTMLETSVPGGRMWACYLIKVPFRENLCISQANMSGNKSLCKEVCAA